jgi:hypothetical protein
MRSTSADFHVIRLQKRAALGSPVLLQCEDDLLKVEHGVKRAAWVPRGGR